MKSTRIKTTLLFLLVIFTMQESFASIAYPYPVNVTQSDGSVITVIMQGDEHLKWAKTLDGYTVVYNTSGDFEYGIINTSGDLVPSGIRAKNINARNVIDKNFLNSVPKGLLYSRSQVSIVHQLKKETPPSVQAFPSTGNRKLICILVSYTDIAFTKTQSDINNLLNQAGHSADGANGSLKDFYLENSYNQLTLTTDVAGPYTLANNRAHYGANTGGQGTDERPREMVTEAVNLANADVNFADYDNDGDGNVDGVYVLYAGHGEEAGAGANAIWAHAWSIPTVTLDGKDISTYSTSAELRGSSGTGITRIGVICHEFGHVTGSKDYYDTDYGTNGDYEGTGDWDLMASGTWNNDGITPAQFNPYNKVYTYGWATATALTTQGSVTLQHSATNSSSYYRYETTTAGEFFILENKQQSGFNASIPGHGLIIYHSHADHASHFGANDVNATAPQYFYPVCANASGDPAMTPASYGTINGGGLPFPGTSNQVNFTDATVPSSKSFGGANTAQPLDFIVEDVGAGTVTFCYLGCPPVADFSADNLTPCTGDIVNFTDLSTYSPSSWTWSFAPGTVTFTGGTNANSQNPKVIFNTSGPYTVTLTATNAYGSDPEAKANYINVNAKPSITLQPVDEVKQWGDNASFTATAIGPPAPTVQWELSIDGGGVWNPLLGETSTTLDLTCVTLEMSGYQYRAVFTNVCGVTPSDAATLTVTPRVTTGTVTIIPNPQQYSDTALLNVVLSNSVICGEQAATSVTFYIGTQLMGTVPLTINGSDLEATLHVVLLEPVPFGTAPTGQMAPGIHTVTAIFNGINPNFIVVPATAPLTINKEDARAYYTGACFASTVSATSANAVVTLAATIKDITAVLGDPDQDIYPGDIRNATVSFINRDNNTIIAANVPLGLVSSSDTKVAVAATTWNVTIAGNSQSFTIGIIVDGYYTRNSNNDNTIVTVSKPLSNFVSGGGYLVLTNSAGAKAGDVGSKNNFGFSVKFNKKGTNLQGNYNSMVRRTEAGVLNTYQIKGNNFTSLAVQKTAVGGKATFNSKANITNVTTGTSVAGNCISQVKLTDNGQPGTTDAIALTIWNPSGGLWFASNWDGTTTIEQILGGGNLVVNSNSSFRTTEEDLMFAHDLNVYPNPTQGHFTVYFNSIEDKPCTVRMIDSQGRVAISQVINASAGENILEYDLNNLAQGIYYFILDVDDNHEVFKVLVGE
jgi:M6 family metalloprotease-like protein